MHHRERLSDLLIYIRFFHHNIVYTLHHSIIYQEIIKKTVKRYRGSLSHIEQDMS